MKKKKQHTPLFVTKEYPVWKYTYVKGEIRKEKYLAREESTSDKYVWFHASDTSVGPRGSRKRIEIVEIDNPCTNNLNQGVYLTEEDDAFALEHFKRCFEERIAHSESQLKKWKAELENLNSIG